MKRATFTAAIRQADSWWFGWIEEVPGVNAQERTREEVLASLRVCLAESLEMNRRDAIEAAGEGFEEVVVTACRPPLPTCAQARRPANDK